MPPTIRANSGTWAHPLAPVMAGLMLAAMVAPALAATGGDKPSAFKRAAAHFKAGEYAQAAPLFHVAYANSPKPVLLFNASLSEQRAGQLEAAARDYRRVIELPKVHPKILKRARAELAKVDAELTARKPSLPAPTSGAPARGAAGAVHSSAGGWQAPAGWAGVGVGAVLLGVGGWLLSGVADQQAELDELAAAGSSGKADSISHQEYKQRYDDLGGDQTLSLVALATGACVLGGGAWLLLSGPADTALRVRPFGRGLALRGSF